MVTIPFRNGNAIYALILRPGYRTCRTLLDGFEAKFVVATFTNQELTLETHPFREFTRISIVIAGGLRRRTAKLSL